MSTRSISEAPGHVYPLHLRSSELPLLHLYAPFHLPPSMFHLLVVDSSRI